MLLRGSHPIGQEVYRQSPRASDTDARQTPPTDTIAPLHARQPQSKKKRLIFSIAIAVFVAVAVGGSFAYWRLFVWQPAVVDPFSAKIIAAMKFPLYYPTKLPAGFRIDTKSVTVPRDGVVVFNMIGPNGAKIYMSEEARPEKFDLGGFYGNFEGLKTTAVSNGSIATGRINGGKTEVASRATNGTWILSNTTVAIPLDQLTTTMKSLTLSYN